ncbi:Energy-dependent translational throttle protein EttA [Balamuthia mandrillaris]
MQREMYAAMCKRGGSSLGVPLCQPFRGASAMAVHPCGKQPLHSTAPMMRTFFSRTTTKHHRPSAFLPLRPLSRLCPLSAFTPSTHSSLESGRRGYAAGGGKGGGGGKRNTKGEGILGKPVFICKDLSKILPDGRPLFTDINITLLQGAKIGVLGPNGTGKSSLCKVIAGLDGEYEGEARVLGNLKVGYLPQEPQLDPEKTVRENVLEGVADKMALLRRLEELTQQLKEEEEKSSGSDERKNALLAERQKLNEKVDELGIRDLPWRIEKAMVALRCPNGDRDVVNLSGGERRRVALCQLLVSQPDMLLLDEPTNHLDAESVAWLESYLNDYPGTVMAVTHDRYFLDNVTGWILELDRGSCYTYKGNYSTWLEAQQNRMDLEAKQMKARNKLIEREREWINSGAKAQVTKNKARIKAYEKLLQEATSSPPVYGNIKIPPGPRLGDVVVRARNLRKTVNGKKLINDFSFNIPPGGIVGVIGPNGAGKTTLLNIITGRDTPDEGELEVGNTVKIGSVEQHRDSLVGGNTIFEEIAEGQEFLQVGDHRLHMRAYVAAFSFRDDAQQKEVEVLSGGERNRVFLAKTLKRGCNLLLLDEPTNDLDVHVLSNLENALQEFAGTAIVVTHDRWFLDRLCTHLIAFEGDGKVLFFDGNYSQYMTDKRKRTGKQQHTQPKLRM